jgi:aryl-alcohol dehydrogenase-like predicted oxidoreductase
VQYVDIPNSALRVSRFCLGSAEIGAKLSVPDALTLLDEFVRLGGTFIDTAHVYSDWIPGTKSTSEKVIGQWMKANGLRDQLVIGTKGGHPALATMQVSRLSRAEIEQDVTESLEYLQTDRIDLYWLHRDDPAIPAGEIVETLNQQAAAGRIRYFGASNWTIQRIAEANDYAQRRGISGFVANQPMWSLAAINWDAVPDKTIVAMDDEALAYHRRTGLPVIPFSSQAHGFFGKLHAAGRTGVSGRDLSIYDNETNAARLERAEALAGKYGASVNDIALAYLLSQPFVTVPIVGCRNTEQLRASLHALDVRLSADEVTYLERGSA